MFNNMGVPGAMSVLGGLAAVGMAAPWVFMRYGERMRAGSMWVEKNVEGGDGDGDGDATRGGEDPAAEVTKEEEGIR